MDEKIVKELIQEEFPSSWKEFKKEYIKRLKESEEAEKIKKITCHLDLIGKCYKFRNSYGSGEKWWLYIQIIGLDKNGELITHEFQKDCNGHITIESDIKYSEPDNEYIPISEKEYKKATDLILQEITDQR